MADYNSDRTGSNIDAVLDKADNLTQAAVGVGGNVGIGTASPEDLLHVNKNGTGEVILAQFENGTNAGGTSASIKLRNHTDVCSTVLESHRNGANFGADFVIKTSNGVSGTIDERFRITEEGNVGIGTASPSAKLDVVGDINVSGGVYLGGTGAANKLDDYEEGVWTPVYSTTGTGFTSITMDASSATYTKVGNLVNVKALIRTDELTLGSASGAVIISGLPFVATAGFGSTATFVYRSGFVNAPLGSYVQSGSNYIILRKSTGITSDSAGVSPSDLTEGTLENQNYVMMDMTYQA